MAGRKPKPTAVKKLEGNPGKRKLNTKEPVPAKGMPDCPEWLLPEAKKEWERLADLMNQMGVLTEVDMAAFAAYCQSYARWKEAQEHIDSEGSTFETDKGYQQQTPWVGIANTNQKLMLQAASEFGLTPSSRSRIVAGSAKGKEPEDELNAGTGDITLWINSPGGDCVAAAQIFNMLSEYPGKVTVKIDGLAASAASVIAMAGTEVWMSPVSMMMIHNPATVAWGDHSEMKKAMELLDAVKESIINAYVSFMWRSR